VSQHEDDTIWLDAEERRAWMALVSVMMRLPHALDQQVRAEANITHFEFTVLTVLSNSPENTMKMSALAATVEGSLSRLSQVVTRLEKRGWVERVPDTTDRRTTWARLTPAGLKVVECVAPSHVATVRKLVIDPLTRTQLRQLAEIGDRIMQATDPDYRLPGCE
jgi:DNA-binding MarR family transcriptional regulator